jgi:hypothetical protein
VAWLSNFAERNLDWKKLKYKGYNDFIKALDSSGSLREMVKQYNSAQQRKARNREAGRPVAALSRTPGNHR